jgi:hypothetical protein
MSVAQSIRHSKASVKVVNQKREGADFIRPYRMLGRDWKEARDRGVRIQDSERLQHGGDYWTTSARPRPDASEVRVSATDYEKQAGAMLAC